MQFNFWDTRSKAWCWHEMKNTNPLAVGRYDLRRSAAAQHKKAWVSLRPRGDAGYLSPGDQAARGDLRLRNPLRGGLPDTTKPYAGGSDLLKLVRLGPAF